MKIVLVGDDGLPVAEIEDLEQYVSSEIWPRAEALGLDRDQAHHLGSVYGSRLSRKVW